MAYMLMIESINGSSKEEIASKIANIAEKKNIKIKSLGCGVHLTFEGEGSSDYLINSLDDVRKEISIVAKCDF